MALTPAGEQRFEATMRRAGFDTAQGPKALRIFIQLAESRVRGPVTTSSLKRAIDKLASERNITMIVGDKKFTRTLTEMTDSLNQKDAPPELTWALLAEGAVTGTYEFDKSTGEFSVGKHLTDALDAVRRAEAEGRADEFIAQLRRENPDVPFDD